MKKIRSYKRVWNFERALHSIYDVPLPKVFTFTQIGWFMGTLAMIVFFFDSILFNLIGNVFVVYLGIPIAVAWFMSQKTFDGKKPHKFVYGVMSYHLNRRTRFAGIPVTFRRKKMDISYTTCERDVMDND